MAARSHRKARRHARSNPRGTLQVTSRGFGFVQTAEGEFFIPASKMGTAFDGDLVEVAPAHINPDHSPKHKGHNPAGQKPTARVVAVVNRSHDTIVGRYEIAEPFGVVVPHDTHIPYDIFTMRSVNPDIKDGSIVRVRITNYPSRHEAATGVIEEVLGAMDDAGVDIETIIANHKLETAFSAASLDQAALANIDEADAYAHGYKDLRDRFVFTVDPVDARDFDDALSLKRVGESWRLGVHIADVAHYVPWDSSIDLDARRRATSVYLVDRVIPMLPEALSGDICSLVPGQPRRVMTVDIFLDDNAKVQHVDYYPAIITSKARLSYDQAQAYLDAHEKGLNARGAQHSVQLQDIPASALPLSDSESATVYEALPVLLTLARCLEQQRMENGGMEFSTTEAKVVLDEEGHAKDVRLRRKTPATMCVEEAMILANRCVAAYLRDRNMPCIYRVHEAPLADSLEDVWTVLQEFDFSRYLDAAAFVSGDPHVLSQALQASASLPQAELISSLILRSMQRAVYRSDCAGHYGLACDAYCHFTSPIRRYPDLVVHRMLHAAVGETTKGLDAQADNIDWLARHSSDMERVADAAARESQELKLVELLSQSIGLSFDALISGVATYGLYVRLDNTAEGLVPVGSLGHEYYALDPKRHTLTGQTTGVSYRLGQRVHVILKAAIPQQRKLEFRLDLQDSV